MSTNFHKLKVVDIEQLTPDCVAIQLNIPDEIQSQFSFSPGQYLTFKKEIKGEEIRRSYSICSTPDDSNITVAVKKIDNGLFSTFANEELSIGDSLESMAPMGNFTSKVKETNKKFLFIAGGSGITPMMSLMKDILANQAGAQVTLLYGNKDRNNIIFKEAIEALKNRYMHQFSVHYIFSREIVDTELLSGRIGEEKLAAFGQKIIDYPSLDEVFLCGAEQMILVAKKFLEEDIQLDQSKINFELFTTGLNVEKKDEWKKKVAQIDATKTSKVTIKLDGSAFEMDLNYTGDNILDAALKSGADLPYACKGGVCATCKAKVEEGTVDMELNYSLEPDEIANNFILTCQAHPRTEKVVIDFDV